MQQLTISLHLSALEQEEGQANARAVATRVDSISGTVADAAPRHVFPPMVNMKEDVNAHQTQHERYLVPVERIQ